MLLLYSVVHFIMICFLFIFLLSGLMFFFSICFIIQYLTFPVLKEIEYFTLEIAANVNFSEFCLALACSSH